MPVQRQIFLFAFLGEREEKFTDDFKSKLAAEKSGTGDGPTLVECLLYAGHAGISFSLDGSIFGFNAKCKPGQVAETLQLLKKKAGIPGVVTDDTAVFDAARARKMEVVCVEYECMEEEFESIQSAFENELESSQFVYCFPGGEGDCNCATWPAKLGLSVPEPTGMMKKYVAAMRTITEKTQPSKSEE